MLRGKKIILGVCGSIAAYKAALLIRLFVKQGAEVKVITTTSALSFITPLTLATLSKNPVLSTFEKTETGEWNNHVALGLWADALVIAPATANTISKMAHGTCDNLLIATYMSAKCPVFVAPAMDLDMYIHTSNKENMAHLKRYGNIIIDAEHGELASGLTGVGRMAEPERVVEKVEVHIRKKKDLKGKRVLITAGPTYETIDPVRFIGNHSSGKMGYALAEEVAVRGAEVILVSGPTQLSVNHPNISVVPVKSAREMYETCMRDFETIDISILSAAVADYTPVTQYKQKVKKKSDTLTLELSKTVDIAAELGKIKKQGQFTVGFALETEDEKTNALKKLKSKKFNLIVLNSLNDKGAGFGHDTNKVTIMGKETSRKFGLKSKTEVAVDIVDAIIHEI